MFGKKFTIDLEFDTHELLFIINDFLKEKGISYSNTLEGNKLRGYGDAGMGVFQIEKKIDRDKNLKLYVEANSAISADILNGIIELALEHIEENNLYETSKETLNLLEVISPEDGEEKIKNEEKEICSHKFNLIKEDKIMDIEVSIYQCENCNKLEFFRR